jgi:non-heme chloroperoxidase
VTEPFSLRAELKGVEVAPGVTLRYWEAGAGRALVMLPGLGHAASLYKYQLEGLCDEFRVIALDPRGHGESDKPEGGYNYHTLAKDLDGISPRTRPQRRDDPRPLRWLQDHLDLPRALR